jgi:2-haloacid dehalogenase
MKFSRRMWMGTALQGLLVGSVASASSPAISPAAKRKTIVAFDALAIFDAAPIAKIAEAKFPGFGKSFAMAWRARIFDTAWISTLGRHYVDFDEACRVGLRHTLKVLNLDADASLQAQLLSAWRNLDVYPDVRNQIARLKALGVDIGFLSNMTKQTIEANLRANGLVDAFDFVISTDLIRNYKPDPSAYALATRQLHVAREAVIFVPSADWDMAGAKWYGFTTYWANRARIPVDGFAAVADLEAPDLTKLPDFVLQHQNKR